jgi:hypothetical protein
LNQWKNEILPKAKTKEIGLELQQQTISCLSMMVVELVIVLSMILAATTVVVA